MALLALFIGIAMCGVLALGVGLAAIRGGVTSRRRTVTEHVVVKILGVHLVLFGAFLVAIAILSGVQSAAGD